MSPIPGYRRLRFKELGGNPGEGFHQVIELELALVTPIIL